jgi:hypothetical protein
VAGDWRRLHNEELLNLYASTNNIKVIKSRRIRWAGYVACMGGIRNGRKIWSGKREWIRPHRRLRRRWDDDMKMYVKENWREDVEWIHLAQDTDQRRLL